MSTHLTEGIVLQKIDYSESSIILKVLTPDQGLQSFIFQGAKRKNKKGNLVSPMAVLSIAYYQRSDSQLGKISAIENELVFKTITFDPYKSSVLFFMNELLLNTIKEKDADKELYTYVRSVLEMLDLSDEIANFPLLFMYRLTKYLGFYPEAPEKNQHQSLFFDQQEGKYTPYMPNHPFYLPEDRTRSLIALSQLKFDNINEFKISLEERRVLLNDLINYYKVIFDRFQDLKSLAILESTFHA